MIAPRRVKYLMTESPKIKLIASFPTAAVVYQLWRKMVLMMVDTNQASWISFSNSCAWQMQCSPLSSGTKAKQRVLNVKAGSPLLPSDDEFTHKSTCQMEKWLWSWSFCIEICTFRKVRCNCTICSTTTSTQKL